MLVKSKLYIFVLSFFVLDIAYGQVVDSNFIGNRNLKTNLNYSYNIDSIYSEKISTKEIVTKVWNKGLENVDLDYYTGILMLHGMSEFALLENNDSVLHKIIKIFNKFNTGEIVSKGNFISYESGGSGAAYLVWKGADNSLLRKRVSSIAAKMMKQQKRSPDELMTAAFAINDQIFIDCAFGVTPYLLYSGLYTKNDKYVNMAVEETTRLFKILKDKNTGLLHQARGFTKPEFISQDNWSRGNGWGAFALATLVRDLPDSHPKRKEVVSLAQQYFMKVIKYQSGNGLWHQEMSDSTSYTETSGSSLILYGLGIMLEKKLINQKYINNFILGLRGLTSYIGSDGSISNTCNGCLNPGKGTKKDYKMHPWVYNDQHAFGSVILAFTQAAKMGINEITPLQRIGLYTIIDSPNVSRTYVTAARGKDIAWENDRIAFRVFGPAVREKVGSGVDIWAKKVNYPILDKWYKLNAEGKDYHTDHGEGCDFYDMGKLRGCGGIAIWKNGIPYPAETYDSYKIIKNQNDKIAFQLEYNTWNVPNLKIEEKKLIEMELGTNFYKVTSTIKSEKECELIVGVGVATFGKPVVYRNDKYAVLSVWEQLNLEQGSMGSAIIVNPKNFVEFASYNGDEYILIKVKTNVPFCYYAGADWEKSKYFNNQIDWENYVQTESERMKF